jgi:predicted transcriptional regulator
VIRGGPSGHPQECPSDPERSRADGARGSGWRPDESCRRPPVQHHPKTVGKWVSRFLREGVEGLRDRSSRPLSSPDQIPAATDAVERLRSERRTQEHIAAELDISKASVSHILKRRGLSRLSSLEPQEATRATSARGPARSSISTSKNSVVSIASPMRHRQGRTKRTENCWCYFGLLVARAWTHHALG